MACQLRIAATEFAGHTEPRLGGIVTVLIDTALVRRLLTAQFPQ
jgi:hypothetical protein